MSIRPEGMRRAGAASHGATPRPLSVRCSTDDAQPATLGNDRVCRCWSVAASATRSCIRHRYTKQEQVQEWRRSTREFIMETWRLSTTPLAAPKCHAVNSRLGELEAVTTTCGALKVTFLRMPLWR